MMFPETPEASPVYFVAQSSDHAPRHTAIIMDGNGRWAEARGMARYAGHRVGAKAVRRVVEEAPRLGIEVLTLYAFSSDNWRRPAGETQALMELLAIHLRSEAEQCAREGVRMTMIGRRDRLPHEVIQAAKFAEELTGQGVQLHLRIAVDYSSREAIQASVGNAATAGMGCSVGGIGEDVDLLIRAGGEQRLSDFLLWECAYAELVFTNRLWPDFDASDLQDAVHTYRRRDRRFGQVTTEALGQLCSRDGSTAFSHIRRDRWLR